MGQTAFRDHVRGCHDRHSRLMLQIMDPILSVSASASSQTCASFRKTLLIALYICED